MNTSLNTNNINDFATLLKNKPVWAAYDAKYYNSNTNILPNINGNSNYIANKINGTINKSIGTGNGAIGNIDYINGDINSALDWNTTTPTIFTLCSITRWTNTTNNNRILTTKLSGWDTQGHHSSGIGRTAYVPINSLDQTYTANTPLPNKIKTDWLVTCGTNGPDNPIPDSIQLDGIGKSINKGILANCRSMQLCINNFWGGEKSDWAFSKLFIWDGALTNNELKIVSNYLLNYLAGFNDGDINNVKYILPYSLEIGMISNTLKTNNSSINDGLIRMNDKKLILQSGSGNPSLIVDTSNNIGIGKNTPTDNFDISGSVIVSNYRIHKQTNPIIDSSGNINTIGNLTVNNNLVLSNNNFSINSSTGNVLINDSLSLGNKLSINTDKFSIDVSGNIKSSGNFDISNNLNINNYTLIDSSGSVILNSLDVSNNTNFKNILSIQNKLDANCLLSDVSFNKVCINNKNLDPSYNFHVVGDSHIVGDLTVNGNVTIMDTIQETTDQLIINNNGVGPAMTINQIGAQPIIDFQDDNKSVFYIADNGLVGIGHSQPNYTLDVSGTVYFLNNLDVSGNLHLLNNISSSNNAKFNNTVDISNNLNINNKFYVDSFGNADTSGNVIVHGSLISKGVLNQNGIFAQSGDTTIDGSLTVRKNIDLSNNLTVNTNSFIADISGNIKASGNFDLSNNFSSNSFNIDNFGNIKVPNNIYLNNSLSVNNFKVNFIGDISSNGTLDISKNFSINTNKFIIDSSGNLFSNGTLDISNNLSVNTNKFTLDSSGNIKSVGTLDLSNNFTINTNKFTVDSNGNIQLLGNLDLSRNLTVNTNKFSVDNLGNTKTLGYLNMFGNFSINNNNFIANNTSGDLKVKGTLDLSKNLIGGNGNFTVDSSGNTKVKGTLDISKNLTVSNVLYVKNNKVGINNSNPSYECDVSGNIGTLNTYLGNVNSNAGFGYRSTDINTNYAIMQTSTGKSTINSKDNIYFTFGGVSKCKLDSSGNVILNGNIYEYSDLNIKKNIETIDLALDKVKGLNGVTYNLTNKEDNRRHIGLIAQDVEKVIPEAVEEDDNIKTVAYGNLVGLLIEAVKELDEKLN